MVAMNGKDIQALLATIAKLQREKKKAAIKVGALPFYWVKDRPYVSYDEVMAVLSESKP
jgi:hypothetical protein